MVTAMFRLATSNGLSVIIGALACIINRPMTFTSSTNTSSGRTDPSIYNGPSWVVVTMVSAITRFKISRIGAPMVNTANTVVRNFITPMCGLSWRTIEKVVLVEVVAAPDIEVLAPEPPRVLSVGELGRLVVPGTCIMWLVRVLVLVWLRATSNMAMFRRPKACSSLRTCLPVRALRSVAGLLTTSILGP